MRSAAFEKHEQVHGQPSQEKKDAEDDHNGKRASGMAEVLRQVLDVGAFCWVVDGRHKDIPQRPDMLSRRCGWRKREDIGDHSSFSGNVIDGTHRIFGSGIKTTLNTPRSRPSVPFVENAALA